MYKIYTTGYINAISFICSVFIFIFICLINKQVKNQDFLFHSIFKIGNQNTIQVKFDSVDEAQGEKENIKQNTAVDSNSQTNNNISEFADVKKQWILKIPKIFLEAEIAEDTTADVMNLYIGHFKETSKTYGNICLAAHNRGYPVNYFENLKLLKQGDIIQYKYNEFTKEYEVKECIIIKDTDWRYLEETEKNVITLITCVENEPEYRRCIRGIEK